MMKICARLGQMSMALVLLCFLVQTGCGAKALPTNETTGKVTFKGAPVADAKISFYPAEGNQYGQMAMTESDADGSYSMRIVSGEGVPEGKYEVSIQPKGYGGPAPCDCPWPEKYCSSGKSGLTAEIVKGRNNINFELVE